MCIYCAYTAVFDPLRSGQDAMSAKSILFESALKYIACCIGVCANTYNYAYVNTQKHTYIHNPHPHPHRTHNHGYTIHKYTTEHIAHMCLGRAQSLPAILPRTCRHWTICKCQCLLHTTHELSNVSRSRQYTREVRVRAYTLKNTSAGTLKDTSNPMAIIDTSIRPYSNTTPVRPSVLKLSLVCGLGLEK